MTVIRQMIKVKADGTLEVKNPALTAGTEVEVIVLMAGNKEVSGSEPYAFLQTLEDARMEGPPDWSEKLEDYLHGDKPL